VVKRGREAGFALPGALLAVFLVSIALALVAASLQLRMRLVQRESRAVTLMALSDAALAEALAHLSENAAFRGSPEHAFGGGSLKSRVQPISAIRFEIEATATYAGRSRTVEAEVIRPPGETPRVVHWRRVLGR
jgi:type II secretory pathway pseudopilin PulG